MTWVWGDRMVGFDLETSGVNPEGDRIVTASVVEVGGGKPTRVRTVIVDPGIEIPEGAAAVHGFTTERVRAEGRPAEVVLPEIVLALGCAIENEFPIVAFNARFDITLFTREIQRLGWEGWLHEDWPGLVVDPLVIDKHLDRFRKGSRNLSATCEHYGVELGSAHESGSDAIAAARLAWVLGTAGEVVRRDDDADLEGLRGEWERVRGDPRLLHEAQVGWAASQAEGLREYFKSKGQDLDAAGVRSDWPLIKQEEEVCL